MSPERCTSQLNIMEEAPKIRDNVIIISSAMRKAAHEKLLEFLPNQRQNNNYGPADEVELDPLVDTRILDKSLVVIPEALSGLLPLTEESANTTKQSREDAENIINHEDDRIMVILGPCSIHDPDATLEYAKKIKKWRGIFGQELEIIMRFYIEKPRTEKDWKGIIADPLLDESDDVNLGIVISRMLACRITDMGVPLATERLNANTPQFLNGLITYDAIGARNAEDQKAREYGSGTSSVVGFKHSTNGNIKVAVQASSTANVPHSFVGVDEIGMMAKVDTKGNNTSHIILRGGSDGPNYSKKHVDEAKVAISSASIKNMPVSIVIDASHSNSGKIAENQLKVVNNVASQIALGETAIVGVMIESNLVRGAQKLRDRDGRLKTLDELEYGKSITDECVGIAETEIMLLVLSKAVSKRRKKINKSIEIHQLSTSK